MDCLEYGRPDQKYSENIRQFSIALSFYSPRGYNYVRSVFQNHLPELHTIQAWLKSVNGSPGITSEALDTLRTMVKQCNEEGRELFLKMMSDEVFLRRNIGWDGKNKDFTGFVTCCQDNNNDNVENEASMSNQLPVAKNALVYMVVGDDFKLTVAYFLLSGLNAQNRAALTQLTIENVEKTGARVMSLTGDGLIANVAMVKELGASFRNDNPYFMSPTNPNHKIYVIWDPPHMLKLARGVLKSHQLYHNGISLHWEFITRLHEMQTQRNINLGNKLTAMHCNFHVKPMNVRIAAETMSNSIADCIQLLEKDGYEEFKNSSKTIEYIRYINNAFDIMNFKPNMSKVGENFKKPLTLSTAAEIFAYAAKAKEFFQSVEIDEVHTKTIKDGTKKVQTFRKLAIKSRKCMPFFGFVHNFTALEGIYNDFITNGLLNEFHTFSFSQDHLETYFSSVRSRLGKWV